MAPAARRIAFVSPRFAEGATVGGAETLLKRLAQRAARAGREVTFLATCARNHFTWANEIPPGEREIEGLRVRFFPVDGNRDLETFLRVQGAISRGSRVTPAEELAWLRNNVNSTALCEHLRREGGAYDRLVMGPYLFGLVYHAAALHPARTLLVPCLHDEPFAYLDAMKTLFGQVRGCLFNSEPERDLAARLFGPAFGAMPVVGMGIEPFAADAAAARRRFGLDGPFVLYSGRREPLKGTPILIDYFDAFRGRTGRALKLVFTGSGPFDVPAASREAVVDLGFVAEEDKHNLMAAATVFCHPSVNESLGIVLLESWQAGTPALVHAAGAVLTDQCRRSGAGLWFLTYPEFEEELALLLDNEPLRAAMGRRGRRYVEARYAWSAVEARLLDALDGHSIGDR